MSKDFMDDFYKTIDPHGAFDLNDDGEYDMAEGFLLQDALLDEDFDEDDFDEDDFDEDDFDEDI